MKEASQTPAPPSWLTSRAKPAGRAKLGLLIKAVASLLLLAFLVQKVDWLGIEVRLIGAAPLPLLAALALLVAAVFVAALRWRMLIEQDGAVMSTGQAAQLTFAGMFFGQVLPATIGGDVVRGVLAYRNGYPWRDVVSGIVLDRVTALLASVLLILAGLPWLAGIAAGAASSLMLTAVASVGLVVVLALGLCVDLVPLPQWLSRRGWIVAGLTLAKKVRTGLASRAGLAALALSLLIHLSTVGVVMLIGAGLGVSITPLAAFLIVPVAILAAAVPVSVNGWGVREGVMVAGLALFGISSGDALLISVLLGFGVILSVLPGSITWLALR